MTQHAKDIFFVGDSYCNCYDKNLQAFTWHRRYQKYVPGDVAHPSIVARHYGYTLHCHGYGGRSWWYSREKFMDELTYKIPEDGFDIAAMVFFHTDPGRINNGLNESLPLLIQKTEQNQHLKYYWTDVHDYKFNEWAQEQWFWEIRRQYSEIKTLHFFSVNSDCKSEWYDILPGMVFTTPLIYVSIGELEGTMAEIESQLIVDSRHNHFNLYNNQEMAKVIIESLDDYRPGKHKLDLDRFYRINKNNDKWPHDHGSK